jgi:hypothetical protein
MEPETRSKFSRKMKTPNRLKKLLINLCLVILALGFAALGFVSFINNPSDCAGSIFSAEHTYSLIGSAFSVLVGTTFLVAAVKGLGTFGTPAKELNF